MWVTLAGKSFCGDWTRSASRRTRITATAHEHRCSGINMMQPFSHLSGRRLREHERAGPGDEPGVPVSCAARLRDARTRDPSVLSLRRPIPEPAAIIIGLDRDESPSVSSPYRAGSHSFRHRWPARESVRPTPCPARARTTAEPLTPHVRPRRPRTNLADPHAGPRETAIAASNAARAAGGPADAPCRCRAATTTLRAASRHVPIELQRDIEADEERRRLSRRPRDACTILVVDADEQGAGNP
jgi:hypothetical protein